MRSKLGKYFELNQFNDQFEQEKNKQKSQYPNEVGLVSDLERIHSVIKSKLTIDF